MLKLDIDWKGLIKAIIKAAFPFFAGAAGGLLSGCSCNGSGLGMTWYW